MMDISEARELLRHIPCGSLSYQEWTNVGAALHKEGLPCSLWDEWSASDPARYHSGECERKWKSFLGSSSPVTGATIFMMAKERGYEKLSTKTESQEICFIPNDDYRDFLKKNVEDFDQKCVPGSFVDMQGRKIGTHQGFQNYTIGQRKGLRVAFGDPRYVAGINAKKNIVKLGERDDLYTSTLRAVDCQFTDLEALLANPKLDVRIRYKSPATSATIETDGKKMKLTFDEPVWGVAPGQSVVLHQDGKVVGGGVVKK